MHTHTHTPFLCAHKLMTHVVSYRLLSFHFLSNVIYVCTSGCGPTRDPNYYPLMFRVDLKEDGDTKINHSAA